MRWLRGSPGSAAGGHGRVLLRVEQCVPFAVVLVGLGIELSPAHFVYTGPLLTAMPPLAALTMGPVGTLSAAAGALAVTSTSATLHHSWAGEQVYSNMLGLFVVSVASVTISNLMRTRRKNELDQIRRIAEAAQLVLLRPVCPRLGPLRAASIYLAAETGAQIGGDLYEAVQTRYGVRMIVGDVRGKGLPAVQAAAAVLGAFRETAHYERDLVEVLDHCAAALRRECATSGHDEEYRTECFVTTVVAQVSSTSEVELVNRGHPPPLLLHEGRARPLDPRVPMPPLGLEDLLTCPPAGTERHPFAPGDRLLLHTDGVVEARDSSDTFFPLPEAMEAVRARGPEEFLEQLHQRLLRHTGDSLADDVAMILVDRLPEDAGTCPHPATGGAASRRAGGGEGR
ncbi:PP2C family protein-serine/threonine phosphatase [Streptomyces sp. NPDC005526]|uniref:PP2C family protein-serine/threonine phosphatase n=1 Tax=Streptomyces sp. NPDC005526 TaxID=3156885 RepID=UPI0033A9EA9D